MERRTQRVRAVGAVATAVRATGALPFLLALLVGAGVAAVDVSHAAAQGCAPRLAVSRTVGLAPAGETVTVSGSCYDVTKGVYVAFCVVPPPGSVPSPCGGGVDMSGANGLSHWISSDPPPQGAGLTTPYGPGGTFTVTMRPSSQLNAAVDCRRVSCAIVTRNDHTRSSDRGQDVIVPVTFAADAAPVLPALPVLPAIDPPAAAPPVTEGPPATDAVLPDEPTSTTTTAPDGATTTTVGAASASVADADDGSEGGELALDVASSSSGGSGAAPAVAAVAAVLLLGAGGGGWWARRRRRGGTAQAGGGA